MILRWPILPRESRLFVKTGMAALLIAFTWGGWMSVLEATGGNAGALLPVEHAHLAFVGWLVNTVIGFALWLLPLNRQRFPQTQGRYLQWMPWTIYAGLNGGLVMRIVSEPLVTQNAIARVALVASAILQVGAIAVFAVLAWSRTRPPARPAAGVR